MAFSFWEDNYYSSSRSIVVIGTGPSKYPFLKEVVQDAFVGVRLGGMGVAIGSLLGEDLAEKLLSR